MTFSKENAILSAIESVSARVEDSDRRISAALAAAAANIEAVTIQIGALSENLTRLELNLAQVHRAIEADREVAKLQAQNINQQSANMQQMVALAAQQQQTINTLIAKIAA